MGARTSAGRRSGTFARTNDTYSSKFMSRRKPGPRDKDDELLAAISHDIFEGKENSDSPVVDAILIGTALMGKMPKADRILKKDILLKLSSGEEWKPMQVALTSTGVFLAKPEEENLRDLIPLYDIRDVKKRSSVPCRQPSRIRMDTLGSSSKDTRKLSRVGGIRNIKSLMDAQKSESESSESFILEIRTVNDGYNSGRTYF